MALRVFDYKTITKNLKASPSIVKSIEYAFGQLSAGKVEVPMPMHIGIPMLGRATATSRAGTSRVPRLGR